MKTATRNTRIGNFGKVVRCFHAGKDNSFYAMDHFGAVALYKNARSPRNYGKIDAVRLQDQKKRHLRASFFVY
jgi:hypothetical protein